MGFESDGNGSATKCVFTSVLFIDLSISSRYKIELFMLSGGQDRRVVYL